MPSTVVVQVQVLRPIPLLAGEGVGVGRLVYDIVHHAIRTQSLYG